MRSVELVTAAGGTELARLPLNRVQICRAASRKVVA